MRSSGKLLSLLRFTAFGVIALALLAGGLTQITPARAGSSSDPGWLGVSLQELDARLRDAMDLERGVRGALVTRVLSGSPADRAGIQDGDVITEFDDERIRDVDDLMDAVRDRESGEKALVVVHRDGKSRGISVVLGSREDAGVSRGRVSREVRDHLAGDKDSRRAPRAGEVGTKEDGDEDGDMSWTDDDGKVRRWKSKDGGNHFEFRSEGKKGKKGQRHKIHAAPKALHRIQRSGGFLGVQTISLEDQLAEYFEVSSGVLVTKVVEDSPAQTSGIQAGDVILAVDGRDVENPRDLRRLVGRLDPEDDLEITIQRRGSRETLHVTLADRKDFSAVPEAPHPPMVFSLPLDKLHSLEGLEGLEHLELPDLENLELHGLGDIELPDLDLNLDWVPNIEIHGDFDADDKERLHEELQKLRDHLHGLKDRIRVRTKEMRNTRNEARDRIRHELKDVRPLGKAERRSNVI